MENKRITKPQLAFQYCKEIAKSINEYVLSTVALQILRENEEIFLTVKGSDWQHHNYAGGLIVHTCNVTLNAIRLGEFYGNSVNLDMIKFCSLMHDVGKLFDYERRDQHEENVHESGEQNSKQKVFQHYADNWHTVFNDARCHIC